MKCCLCNTDPWANNINDMINSGTSLEHISKLRGVSVDVLKRHKEIHSGKEDTDFLIGLDLGQAQDYTALTILERYKREGTACHLPSSSPGALQAGYALS